MKGRYRFAVRFRLHPPDGFSVDPAAFETALRYRAPPPGESGWRFFRDYLWRGEVNDPDHVREMIENALDLPVEDVQFRAFEVDREYLDALRDRIAADLDEFRAESADEVVNKYLASRLEVESTE